MVYSVEVRLVGGGLLTAMSDMRTWLDHQRYEPDAFRCSRGTPITTLRLDFRRADEANAFAAAFGGRLLGSPAGETPQPAEALEAPPALR